MGWPEAVLFGDGNGGMLKGDGPDDGKEVLSALLPDPSGVGTLPVPAVALLSAVVLGSG